jgi:hypothetical protein
MTPFAPYGFIRGVTGKQKKFKCGKEVIKQLLEAGPRGGGEQPQGLKMCPTYPK